jgi:hypothetical protein
MGEQYKYVIKSPPPPLAAAAAAADSEKIEAYTHSGASQFLSFIIT